MRCFNLTAKSGSVTSHTTQTEPMVFYVYLAHIYSQQIIFIGKYQVKYIGESRFKNTCVWRHFCCRKPDSDCPVCTCTESVNVIQIQIQTRFRVNKQTPNKIVLDCFGVSSNQILCLLQDKYFR